MPVPPPVMTATFPSDLSHNYLFVLVGLKFVQVIQLDTYYAMISDVEHYADDSGPARTNQKDDPCHNLPSLMKSFLFTNVAVVDEAIKFVSDKHIFNFLLLIIHSRHPLSDGNYIHFQDINFYSTSQHKSIFAIGSATISK